MQKAKNYHHNKESCDIMTNEELTTAIKNGNHDLIEQLWYQCYGFIRQQAIRWATAWENRPDFDIDDLTQAGYIALCEAVKGYQEGRGNFIGFLSFYLKTEFSKVAGCRTSKKEPLNSAFSLDAPANNDPDNEITLGESVPIYDTCLDDVDEALFNQQLASVLDQAMGELPGKQSRVIELHYLHGMTYKQIAGLLHYTASYPGQLAKDGLKGMKRGRYAPTLSEMLYGDRNYYRHTSYASWKYSGSSSPEWELLKKEDRASYNIRDYVKRLGLTFEQSRRLFPV